ncbi:MAG: RDD family protein [Verrucomicrobiaceae bacterium]
MQFWYIEDGEKKGPLEDYDFRELIRNKEVTGETRVWYEGADGWQPAKEVDLIRGEFERSVPEVPKPPPLPTRMGAGEMWSRLGARWFDIWLYQFFILLILRAGGIPMLLSPDVEISGWVIAVHFVPALLVEGILLHLFGTTAGKWIFRLSLEDGKGNRLGLGASVMRSMRVWVLGVGMKQPLLIVLGHLLALWAVRKHGAPFWDLVLKYRVKMGVLSGGRIGIAVTALVLILAANVVVVWPEVKPMWDEAWNEAMARQAK